MTLAPIVLFVYNRPWHSRQTIEALKKNELAFKSKLIIFSDAAKNESSKQAVDEVRAYIKSVAGFKEITIIEREKNWGLADSIIDGVTTVVNQYGKIIVLEDDLVTSPYFLRFMNGALDFYQNEEKVWHISGWNYPIDKEGLGDVFLWRLMNCWGWATWADRWKYYEKDVDKVINAFNRSEIKAFNLDETDDFFSQVKANKQKKINTWAIFWYATIFKHKGLCLNPVQTFVENIGHDGTGIHCANKKDYIDILNMNSDVLYTLNFVEDYDVLNKVKALFLLRKPFLDKMKRKLLWK